MGKTRAQLLRRIAELEAILASERERADIHEASAARWKAAASPTSAPVAAHGRSVAVKVKFP